MGGRMTGRDPDGRAARSVSRRRFMQYVGAFAAVAGCGDDTAESTLVTGSATLPVPRGLHDVGEETTTPETSATTETPTTTSPSTTAERPPPTLAVTFPGGGRPLLRCADRPRSIPVPRCTIDGPEITFEGSVSDGAEVFARGAPAVVAGGHWTLTCGWTRERTRSSSSPATAMDAKRRTSVAVIYEEKEPSDF